MSLPSFSTLKHDFASIFYALIRTIVLLSATNDYKPLHSDVNAHYIC